MLAGDAGTRRLRAPARPNALAVAAFAIAAYGFIALVAPIDAYVTSFVPGPERTADRRRAARRRAVLFPRRRMADARASGAARGAYPASKLAFLVSLGVAVALDFERLFFLILIVPIIATLLHHPWPVQRLGLSPRRPSLRRGNRQRDRLRLGDRGDLSARGGMTTRSAKLFPDAPSDPPRMQARTYPEPAAVLELLKPITWFPPMWAFACGVVSSGRADPAPTRAIALTGIVLAGPLVCAMSQAINDWCDREVDAINEPNRPIPSGRIPGSWGLYIAIIWTVLSLLVAATLGRWVLIAAVRRARARLGL